MGTHLQQGSYLSLYFAFTNPITVKSKDHGITGYKHHQSVTVSELLLSWQRYRQWINQRSRYCQITDMGAKIKSPGWRQLTAQRVINFTPLQWLAKDSKRGWRIITMPHILSHVAFFFFLNFRIRVITEILLLGNPRQWRGRQRILWVFLTASRLSETQRSMMTHAL